MSQKSHESSARAAYLNAAKQAVQVAFDEVADLASELSKVDANTAQGRMTRSALNLRIRDARSKLERAEAGLARARKQ